MIKRMGALFLCAHLGFFSQVSFAQDIKTEIDSNTIKAQVTDEEQEKQATEEGGQFSGKLQGGVRIIELKASKFKFEPEPIVVKKGERVRLVATSTDVTHGIAIPEFKINLVIPTGKTSSIEFTADKEGTFRTHCSVFCGLGHGKMRGTFVVK